MLPNAPEKLMNEFFEESSHRRKREVLLDQRRSERLRQQNEKLKQEKLGRYLGFVIALSAIAAAIVLGLNGQPVLGGVLGGGAILSVAIALIRG